MQMDPFGSSKATSFGGNCFSLSYWMTILIIHGRFSYLIKRHIRCLLEIDQSHPKQKWLIYCFNPELP